MIYKVKLVSQRNSAIFIIFFLIILFGGSRLFIPFGLHNTISSITLVSIEFLIAYFLWQKLVTGKTEWTIDDKEIRIIWKEHFAFTKNKDIILEWREIQKIWRGIDPNYYNLKIKLLSGKTIKFIHDTLTTKDDFNFMLKELYQKWNNKK